jgi:hypothetical protein
MINGPDSISDPFARRLRCIESYPSAWRLGSAPKTARFNSARLAADDVAGGSHCADVSNDWTLTWHATYACWHHAYVMMTSSLSGSGTWVGSSGIRVESALLGEEDAWDAWRASVRMASHPSGA